ncbi:hypothetical protein [Flavobacterium beibuense]|uniref:hypothetical protein n=1 Tax=Flavobacterium beibuense TaxID=657326 RepID=UPI003A919CE4
MTLKLHRKINSYKKKDIIEIIKKICINYRRGEFTLESCCKNAGVPYRTFKDWWARYEMDPHNKDNKWNFLAEVAGLWENAKNEHRKENEKVLMHKAESLLTKAVTGYEYEEITTIYSRSIDKHGNVTLVPVGFRKKKRFRPPSVSAIIFVLTKLKPEIYGQRVLVVNDKIKDEYEGWTMEKIDAELERLKKNIT